MAYYTGSANDMTAVRQALIDACVGESWSWNSSTDVLNKGDCFVRLALSGGYLRLYGRSSASSGEMAAPQQMGPFTGSSGAPLPSLTWPVSYELFLFEQEVYCVINYNADTYQWCAFGQSTVDGLPGTGAWVGASADGALTSYFRGIHIGNNTGTAYGANFFCPALFWATANAGPGNVHSDLDGQGWWLAQSATGAQIGIKDAVPLIGILPNAWNSEAVLLPLRAYKIRPSSKLSLVADLEHARYTRVDNYAPGEIITIGSERWKVFPWFRKNSSARNGGSDINHTGTFGWAIRYEGP